MAGNQPRSLKSRGVKPMKKYRCLICGLIYDQEKGWPDDGILPGTSWTDAPPAWACPECGGTKDDFKMVEI